MHVRSLRTVVFGLTCSAALACASGEIDEGSGTFTTNTTNTTTNNGSGNDSGSDGTTTRDEDGETGHQGETGDTDEPPPPDPTCDDGEQNQGETDLDCGGPNCEPCGDGQACADDVVFDISCSEEQVAPACNIDNLFQTWLVDWKLV
ncbi:MAG: hypothetical protein R6X02_23100 [Enhygromyxa sp.]